MHFHGKCILIQIRNRIANKRLDIEHDVYSKVVKIHSRIPDSLCCIQINMHNSQHHPYTERFYYSFFKKTKFVNKFIFLRKFEHDALTNFEITSIYIYIHIFATVITYSKTILKHIVLSKLNIFKAQQKLLCKRFNMAKIQRFCK